MITVSVAASKQYDVLIGTDILPGLGKAVREVFPSAGRAALVTDTTVGALYGASAEESLRAAGFDVPRYASQETIVRTEHGTADWFQMEKEYVRLYTVTLLI